MPRAQTLVAIRPSTLSVALAAGMLLIGSLVGPTLAVGGSEFVSLTNVKRASVGLGPVSLSSPVDQIAVERGNQMASADSLAHNLTYVTTRLGQLGVCWSAVGEIIAWEKGYPTHSYQRTIDQWWASSGHHAIMVGDYNVAGGSWSVSSSGGTYSVMVFVKTCSSAPPAATSAPAIMWRSPGFGATSVSVSAAVAVRFSEAVHGVSGSTFVLLDAATGAKLAATVTYDGTTFQATLRPSGWLQLGRMYRVGLSSFIRDAGGSGLADTSWTFKTSTAQSFSPARLVSLSPGTHVGYRFGTTGAILASKAYALARWSSASATKRALVTGRSGTWYLISNGVWAGYWMQASAGVVLH
jgi:Bacterial Ig-like domain/Cysteine-rich secretory protein family